MQRLSIKAFQQSRWPLTTGKGHCSGLWKRGPVRRLGMQRWRATALADGGRLWQHAWCVACRCEERAVMGLTSSGHPRAVPAAHLLHYAIGDSA